MKTDRDYQMDAFVLSSIDRQNMTLNGENILNYLMNLIELPGVTPELTVITIQKLSDSVEAVFGWLQMQQDASDDFDEGDNDERDLGDHYLEMEEKMKKIQALFENKEFNPESGTFEDKKITH